MALFTGKGDEGTSKIFSTPNGQRISKASEVFEALGTVDELNSFLGMCKTEATSVDVRIAGTGPYISALFHQTQQDLFIIQAELAGSEMRISENKITEMEHTIKIIEEALPPITTFFISGGTRLAALCDTARAITRRAERSIIRAYEKEGLMTSQELKTYMNRLSSLLYALARYANFSAGLSEDAPTYQ